MFSKNNSPKTNPFKTSRVFSIASLSIGLLTGSVSTLASSETASIQVGFSQQTLYVDSTRPLHMTLWYPTLSSPSELIAENRVFKGTQVAKDGLEMEGSKPLVLISHGYRGSWRNQNWLAHKLVQAGYRVAAVDHPGTTSFDRDPNSAIQWWERPRDVSRLLDWLMQNPEQAAMIDPQSIYALGHSLGAFTIMQLAGAQINKQQLADVCDQGYNRRICSQLAPELGLTALTTPAGEPQSFTLKDPRISKFVSLDIGAAQALAIASLNAIQADSLILAAGRDIAALPSQQESGFLSEHMPLETTRYRVYQQASHFSFMQLCKTGAIAILEEESPGDGVVCEAGTIPREDLHDRISADILGFFGQTL